MLKLDRRGNRGFLPARWREETRRHWRLPDWVGHDRAAGERVPGSGLIMPTRCRQRIARHVLRDRVRSDIISRILLLIVADSIDALPQSPLSRGVAVYPQWVLNYTPVWYQVKSNRETISREPADRRRAHPREQCRSYAEAEFMAHVLSSIERAAATPRRPRMRRSRGRDSRVEMSTWNSLRAEGERRDGEGSGGGSVDLAGARSIVCRFTRSAAVPGGRGGT